MREEVPQLVVYWLLKNVTSAVKTRQNPTKKRSLCVINEHVEEDLNALLSSAVVFQPPVEGILVGTTPLGSQAIV